MTLATTITTRITSTLTSALDLVTASVPLDHLKRTTLADGTGADQADLIFHDQRTLAASSNEDLDLAGSLADALGTTLTYARIKALFVSAASGNTNDVQVAEAQTNGVSGLFLASSDGVAVRPGGTFLWTAPDATAVAVTAGTGDLINVANSAGGSSVTYDVVIIGASS